MTDQTAIAQEKVDRATRKLVLGYPWWATLFMQLKQVPTETLPTMAVDGTHLFFNPEFTIGLPDSEVLAVLLHETAHIALLHIYRKQWREHRLWNIACDAEVNALLENDGQRLPAGCVPAAPLGKVAEEIYDELLKSTKKHKLPYGDVSDLMDPSGTPQDGNGDGQPNDVREVQAQAGKDGKPMNERDWRDALAQSRGLQPAGIERILKDSTEPKQDWRELLAQFMHATVKSDSKTWTRVSRRLGMGNPGWRREPETNVGVIVDTSGSIDGPLLDSFVSEAKAIADINGMRITLMACDAAVHNVIDPGEPWPKSLGGGGGTDFTPALAKCEELQLDAVVYLTDLAGRFPKDCSLPVFWASIVRNGTAPFGKVVYVGKDGGK